MNDERIRIRVVGRVQGVAFRWHTQRRATRLGLTGTVRNEPDGSVKIVAEGERSALEAFADWTLLGPETARVDRRELDWCGATGEFDGFDITG